MNPVLAALARHAAETPHAVAICSGDLSLNYTALADVVRYAKWHLDNTRPAALGLALDNSPVWAVLDLAALRCGIPAVPLPAFFSAEQIAHSVQDSGIDRIFTDNPQNYLQILENYGIPVTHVFYRKIHGLSFAELVLSPPRAASFPEGTAKITYTSGTTGQPKGVCLGADALCRVAVSLCAATEAAASDCHLSLLPLATLLENIGGLYVPILAGATACLPPLAETGLEGAAGLDARRMAAALTRYRPTTTILVPQMLQALLAVREAGLLPSPTLRFIAVGGAPVAARLLARAEELGLPVFEGYGLSECASVVSLNTPAHRRTGSAGKPLPHVRLAFAPDGEILVAEATLLGHGESEARTEFWPTGDLGHLDSDGFLHLAGRKKNIFITSFGRNVSPEWVESELIAPPAIAQAAVFGEGRPWNSAVIVPRAGSGGCAAHAIPRAIAEANAALPDYARVRTWIAADAPFAPQNGQLTANGRLRREAVWPVYRERIAQLYQEENYDAA